MVRAQASRTVLRIRYKSFSIYLGIKGIVAGMKAIERFTPKDSADWLNNSSFDSKSGKKSKRVMEERS